MNTESNVVPKSQSKIGIRTIAQIGMLSAIATVLMLFEIPLPFAPAFYQIDFSAVSYTHLDVYKRQGVEAEKFCRIDRK